MAMFGEEDVPIPKPVQRSLSVCAQPSLGPAGAAAAGGWPAGDSRFPPVLVMSHPSTRKMATRLVQATTARITKLKMQPNVCMCERRFPIGLCLCVCAFVWTYLCVCVCTNNKSGSSRMATPFRRVWPHETIHMQWPMATG